MSWITQKGLDTKDRLQLELMGAHREAEKEDEARRIETRARMQYLEKIGWWDTWEDNVRLLRNAPHWPIPVKQSIWVHVTAG